MFEVKYKEQLASGIFQMAISAPRVAKKALPGQFIILKIDEYGERIPLTIKDNDPDEGTVTIVFQVAGKSTLQLSLLQTGEKIDLVLAIGPLLMMKSIADVTQGYGVHTLVSLNPIMVDGTGMCGGCRVTVGGVTKFTCVDVPEFDAHLVDFDELFMRQRYYLDEEKLAKEKHCCRLPI